MLPTSLDSSAVLPSRNCAHCGKTFPIVNGRHRLKRFCTDECRGAWRPTPTFERFCKECGDSFFAGILSKKIFCSKKCGHSNYRAREDNFEKERASVHAWIKANPKKRREIKIRSYLKHADTERKRNVAYNKAHPEERRLAKIRRRVRERGAAGSYTLKEFALICEKQGGKCAHCKKKCKLTVDHIVPLSKGGTDFAYNIQGLCGSCNTQKLATILPYAHPSLFDSKPIR
jgi:hypothetical protein